MAELRKSASSMFVAVFEAMFQVRQKDIVRKPQSVGDYAHNAQVIIDALAGPILNMDLSHISADAIVAGHVIPTRNLVDIFMGISEVVLRRRLPEGEGSRKPSRGGLLSLLRASEKGAGKVAVAHMLYHPGIPTHSHPHIAVPSSLMQFKKLPGAFSQAFNSTTQALRQYPPQRVHSLHAHLSLISADTFPLIPGLVEEGSPAACHSPGEAPRDFPDLLLASNFTSPCLSPHGDVGLAALAHLTHLARSLKDRERKMRLYYRRILKERLAALRKKEHLDMRRQYSLHRNRLHANKVRQIRTDKLAESLHLRGIAARMHHEEESQASMGSLYAKIASALHRQKAEDDREDAARLRALHEAYDAEDDNLEDFFRERVALVHEHELQSQEERTAANRAQQRLVDSLCRQAAENYEEALERKMDKMIQMEDAMARRSKEAHRAFAAILGVEDWSGNSQNRLVSVGKKSMYEKRMHQINCRAGKKQRQSRASAAKRKLRQAYAH
ncbi:unnamed protein product [Chrysoparadoxa australica]